MLVICEDCAKKYNIDESRIRGRRARFTCNECGHIIIVDKADLTRSLFAGKTGAGSTAPPLDLLREMEVPVAPESDGTSQKPNVQTEPLLQEQLAKRKNRGIPVFAYFITAMLFALVCVSLVFGYLSTEYLCGTYLVEAFKEKTELRVKLLLESSLFFGVAGAFLLVIFSVLARLLQAKDKFRSGG